jgi:hypothetical protein
LWVITRRIVPIESGAPYRIALQQLRPSFGRREILCEQVRLNRKDANPQGAAPSAKVLMFSQQLVAD